MRKEDYLSISEFAKISDVSRKKLICYDRIGLFKPALVKPDDYRCYAHWQIEEITVISVLSEPGISLEEIKKYLHQYEPGRALALFREQDQAIEYQIEKLRSMRCRCFWHTEQPCYAVKFVTECLFSRFSDASGFLEKLK